MKNRSGFTLVEMLVAVGLILLMMLLFASIFQTSANLVSDQKGMAKLDQHVRTLTVLLRGDIGQRTFRRVIPFVPGQDTTNAGPSYSPENRQGFFSISENDPHSATDDVLHFTVTSDADGGSPRLPFSGRASLLFNGMDPADHNLYLADNPDQPEFDDGQPIENRTGSSRFAEVVWFLRDGKLYRRQLLVREPYSREGNTGQEPQDRTQTEFIATTYASEEHVPPTNPNGVFWRDFDYSAYADLDGNTKFHSMPESLNNLSSTNAVPELDGFPPSIGVPFLRYGGSVPRAVNGDFGPREFLDPANAATFIGRFTVEESTHNDFAYPGNSTPATDPFSRTDLTITNAKVTQYEFSDLNQRRGDDLVMADVHSFDVQVWDDIMNEFVDLGHQQTATLTNAAGQPVPNVPGWFHENRKRGSFGNSFDTWHPHNAMPETPYAPFGDPANSPDPNDERVDRGNSTFGGGLGDPREVSLKSIKILIRFYDVGSDSIRDLTFTFPLEG